MKNVYDWKSGKAYEGEWGKWGNSSRKTLGIGLPNDSFFRIVIPVCEDSDFKIINKVVCEKLLAGIGRMNFQDTYFLFEIYPGKIECTISQKGQPIRTWSSSLESPPKIIVGVKTKELVEKFIDGFAP